ncbi:MAG: hypothetical protein ACK5TR_04405 [Alphaproteobacteria bacterium]|jgi:hypothetical protein|nr:hypothetical protein [Alphaproteobacteria bacterium]
MKQFLSLFSLLLVGASLAVSPVCQASATPLDDTENPSSLSRLPVKLQWIILEKLTPEEEGRVATDCNLWHQGAQEHLTAPLRLECDQMLYDVPTPFRDWSLLAANRALALTLDEDGFVFVPFGPYYFPEHSTALCDEDVAPFLSQLYEKAFSEKKEALSSQDLLCLKAVLPWSRVVVDLQKEGMKAKALNVLLDLKGNPSLIRFSQALTREIVQNTPHTLVLTNQELKHYQRRLKDLFGAHPDQCVHLVTEVPRNIVIRSPSFPSSEPIGCLALREGLLSGVRHLRVSNPHHEAALVGKFSLAPDLISLDIKDWSALRQVFEHFAEGGVSLVSFDPRGLTGVVKLDETFLHHATNLNDDSKKKIERFRKEVEERHTKTQKKRVG